MYELPAHSEVSLIIYDIVGREVQTVVKTYQETGSYTVTWNSTDREGQPATGGMYFARLQAGENSSVVKMVIFGRLELHNTQTALESRKPLLYKG